MTSFARANSPRVKAHARAAENFPKLVGEGRASWCRVSPTEGPRRGPRHADLRRARPAANVSSRCGEQILSRGRAEKVLIGGALTALTLVTVCGNLLVVISVCFVKKLRQPSNYLIVSLAVADLSVALAVMPFVSVTDLIGGRWVFGRFFCNVFIAMDVMCCTASIMTLCLISIDRHSRLSVLLRDTMVVSGVLTWDLVSTLM
uniref:G-protein coupled receptors family 1 profile domain-containing protein n=1 Tax=Denticeps clupeoides TaxID=299321 RepID=A0AAY4C3G4_9TELE